MSLFTNEQKLEAIERELKFRRRVYPERVNLGKMTKQLMDYQIGIMEQIAEDYRGKAQSERLI